MSDQPIGATVAEPDEPEFAAPRHRRRPHRTDWRLGGRTVRSWRERTLAVALIGLGAGTVIAALIGTISTASWAATLATVVGWLGMLVPIVWALSRSRPIGLLRFRAVDLLFGIVLALVLRTVDGWMQVALGGTGEFPSYTTVNGELSGSWWFDDAVGPVLIAPTIEELFFRGVLLVALYSVLRRPFGKISAGIASGLVTTGVFVLVHAVAFSGGSATAISLALLGAVCAALVLLTGRIWAAVVTHLVFNLTYVLLALIGTVVG